MRALLGYPLDGDATGWDLSLVHPDDAESARHAVVEVAAGRRTHREPIRVRVRATDGSWRHFETVATNLVEEPSVRGIVLISRDITERVLAEEASRESEERFRIAFEHAPIGMGLADRDGRILRVNAAYAEMLGRIPEDLVGMTVRDFHPPR